MSCWRQGRRIPLGVKVFIGSGQGENKLLNIMAGHGDGTYVGKGHLSPLKNTKQWIAFHSAVTGRIFVDEGAEQALLNRKQLAACRYSEAIRLLRKRGCRRGSWEIRTSWKGRGAISFLYPGENDWQAKHSSLAYGTNMSMEIIHRDQWVTIPKERKIINE